ncbi:hypothetical protein Pint_16420 [Pistacia integerrima]|uniref:Uncharacterized protein n=1 Tax=Pistacia integerrima TaxID=434235 RepID=A0ACC0ZEK5_9ROSI|nr:hypothetical protein Pint_16420 [Pistacia integerrima]
MMTPLPSINQAYSMLIIKRVEEHQHIFTNDTPLETTVLFSSSHQSTKSKKNWNLVCEHCNIKGHKKENCYRLIGYPPDFKFTKKKGQYQPSSAAHNVTSSDRTDTHTNTISLASDSSKSSALFTKEQYAEILKLLHKDIPHSPLNDINANMAGIQCYLSSLSNKQSWILDTGASHHMSHCIEQLVDLASPAVSPSVKLPNGHVSEVSHIGSCFLNPTQKLTNVLYVPDFKFNLISIAKLTKDLSCYVSFFPDFCVIQDLSNGQVKGIGRQTEGLYFLLPPLPSAQPPSELVHSRLPDTAVSHAVIPSFPVSNNTKNCMNSSYELWHKRLGHVPIAKLKYYSVIKHAFVKDDHAFDCHICPLAKQTRMPFTASQNRASAPFTLIHMDVWGPYSQPAHNGHRFFLTLVDDFTRVTWIFLMQHKHETVIHLKTFIALVHTQFSASLKIVRSDNGSEFFNSQCAELFTSLGIIHQSSCVATPQQNGVVERKHRHLLEVARALRIQTHIPIPYWSECILTACYIINRLPIAVLSNKSPYEHSIPEPLLLSISECLVVCVMQLTSPLKIS